MFIEDNQALQNDQLQQLFTKIRDRKINFYFSENAALAHDNGFHFCCEILDRNGKKSDEYSFFEMLLIYILEKNNLKLKNIFRISLNVTFYNGFIFEVPLHTDHQFPHKQLLLYLNNSSGDTVIPSINKSITPEENKAIIFDGIEHKHFFPDNGIRMVCVFTFNLSDE